MRTAAFVVLLALAACSKGDDGTTPRPAQSLPALTIRDDTPGLLLTWIDERGNTHTSVHPADVPPAGRPAVRVVVSEREAGTGEQVYVVDLTKPGPDGGYTASTMSRRDWETEIERRREAQAKPAGSAPPPPASAQQDTPPAERAPSQSARVVIYGASWCGPCHEAARYLKAKGIPYVMKDIETTDGAAEEMNDKLRKAGQRSRSIPVIDVDGQILVGFSQGALDRALRRGGSGTTL